MYVKYGDLKWTFSDFFFISWNVTVSLWLRAKSFSRYTAFMQTYATT